MSETIKKMLEKTSLANLKIFCGISGKNLSADSAVNILEKIGKASLKITGKLVKNDTLSLTIGGKINAKTKTSHATVVINTTKAESVLGRPRRASLLTTGLSALMKMNARNSVNISSLTIQSACRPIRKTTVKTIVFHDISTLCVICNDYITW